MANVDINDEQGWYSRGYIPHCDRIGARQFITTRLADSMPHEVVQRLRRQLGPEEFRANYQKYLDNGFGDCLLGIREVAEIVRDNLLFHDGRLYDLNDWLIMPNHLHVDITQRARLPRILHAWRSFTSKRVNELLDRGEPRLWQRGPFDRLIRDSRHAANVQCYIYLNPVKAGLVDDPFDWEFSSIHRHSPEWKGEIRKWYRKWQKRFYESV